MQTKNNSNHEKAKTAINKAKKAILSALKNYQFCKKSKQRKKAIDENKLDNSG